MEKEREITMYKYIFLDVDGTLYSPLAGETPQSAIEALKRQERMDTRFSCVPEDHLQRQNPICIMMWMDLSSEQVE